MKAALLFATFAFRGATLLDGTGARPIPDSLLVVVNGQIVSVGTATAEALDDLSTAAQVVSLEGKWIIPGLIDAHVHVTSDAELKEMLRWGVTSVRLMAEDVAAARDLANRSMDRKSGLPNVFPSAPIFTCRHGWWGQDEPPDANLDRYPSSPEEAGTAVVEARRLGAQEIKVMFDDMAWCRAPLPVLPKLNVGVMQALVRQARARKLRVTVHAPEPADAGQAVEAGATALAHGVLGPLGAETVRKMKRRPVYYIPTMGVFEFLADPHGFIERVFSDRRASEGLAPGKVAQLRSKAYAEQYRRRFPNSARVKSLLPALYENLRRLQAAGVPIALGTDMWALPGLGVSVEMELYVKAGLSPLEAIRTATQTAAKSLGVGGNWGTLERGKRADFLVLSEDPLTDIRNVRAIADVYKNGERVGPAEAAPAKGFGGRSR